MMKNVIMPVPRPRVLDNEMPLFREMDFLGWGDKPATPRHVNMRNGPTNTCYSNFNGRIIFHISTAACLLGSWQF